MVQETDPACAEREGHIRPRPLSLERPVTRLAPWLAPGNLAFKVAPSPVN